MKHAFFEGNNADFDGKIQISLENRLKMTVLSYLIFNFRSTLWAGQVFPPPLEKLLANPLAETFENENKITKVNDITFIEN